MLVGETEKKIQENIISFLHVAISRADLYDHFCLLPLSVLMDFVLALAIFLAGIYVTHFSCLYGG